MAYKVEIVYRLTLGILFITCIIYVDCSVHRWFNRIMGKIV